MASPNIDQIVTTTLESRTGKLADDVTKNTALLFRLEEKGKVKPFSGGRVIYQEMEYAENGTAAWYYGYETLDTSPSDVITAAQFEIKQMAGSVTISGLEQLQNAGKEQIIDLLEARIANLEKTMINTLSTGVYSDGTGANGKQIGGLQLLVPDAPTSGTVGGINRANWTFWQSQKFAGVADGGAAVSAANIKKYLSTLRLKMIRGKEGPDICAMDNTYYELLLESLQAIQRISTDSTLAKAGFQTINYQGVDYVCDGGYGGACPAAHAYMLNTDYIYLRPHSARNMTVIGGNRVPVNQDAIVKIVAWAGNMTVSNSFMQGVLIA